MKLKFTILLLLVCLPSFGQRFVDETETFSTLKARNVFNLDKSVFVRGGITQGDGLGGIYTLTNSVVGADGFKRIQSTFNPAWSYDRWIPTPLPLSVPNGGTGSDLSGSVGGAIPYFDFASGKFITTGIAWTNLLDYEATLGFLSIAHTNDPGNPLLFLGVAGAGSPSIQGYADKFVVANTNLSLDAVGPYSVRTRINGGNILNVGSTGVSFNNKTNIVADNGTTLTYNGIPIGGFIFREQNLGTIAGGATATLNTNVYFYRATFSGSTFNVDLPTLSASSIYDFAVIKGSNTFGATQIGTFKVAGVTTALGSERDHGFVTTMTNEIGAFFTVTFRSNGGVWSRVDSEGDGTLMAGSGLVSAGYYAKSNGSNFVNGDIFDISSPSSGLNIGALIHPVGIAINSGGPYFTSDDQTYTVFFGRLEAGSDTNVASMRTFHLATGWNGSAAGNNGFETIIVWNQGGAGELPATDANLVLTSTWTPGTNDMISLVYLEVDSKWHEQWRYPSSISPFQRITSSTVGLNSSSNILTTSGAALVYTNALPKIIVQSPGGTAFIDVDNSGQVAHFEGGSSSAWFANGNQRGVIAFDTEFAPSANNTISLGSGNNRWKGISLSAPIYWNGPTNTVFDAAGNGDPNGSLTADKGSTWRRFDGGAGTCFYVKETSGVNTGWVPK